MRSALVPLFLLAAPAVARDDLRLVLVGPELAVHVGDTFLVQVELRGAAVERLLSSVKDRRPPPFGKEDHRFVLPVSLVADKAGPLTVGPWELEVFGRKLRSNTLRIEVTPPPPPRLELSAEPAACAVGEPFALTATLVGRGAPELRESPSYAVSARSTNVELKMLQGVQSLQTRKTWEVKAKKAGTLRFDRASFEGLPADATVSPVSVEVR